MKNKKVILYINYLIILLSALAILFNFIKCEYFSLIVMTFAFISILLLLIVIVMLNSGEKHLKIELSAKHKRYDLEEDESIIKEFDEETQHNKCLEFISGLDKDLEFETLLEQKILKLADAIQLVAAIAYVKNSNDLNISSCYALVKSEQKQKLSLDEGLTGQVAKDGKPIEVSITDQISLEIISGLGKSKPKFLYLLPVFEQDEIKGVVELATFIKLSDTRIEFLIEALKR
jgi:hypothetical protein